MSEQDKKSSVDLDPTRASLLLHYKNELATAIKNKDLERVKVVKSVITVLYPTAFKK
jgi:hypothetical protein